MNTSFKCISRLEAVLSGRTGVGQRYHSMDKHYFSQRRRWGQPHPKAWQTIRPNVPCRNAASKDGFVEKPGINTLYDMFENSVKKHGGRKCLGWRPINNGKAGDFQWISYKQAHGTTLGN